MTSATGRIYSIAIYVQKPQSRGVVYVGDAIELDGCAWLVLTWDSDEKLFPVEKLPLDEEFLTRFPPEDAELEVDWHYTAFAPLPATTQ